MSTLGVDLAVRAAHVATLSDDRGEVIWSRRRFTSRPDDLAALSAAVGPAAELTVVMEPTRSAWVVVAAHFRATGAKVVMIAPEQSADLRNYYKKHTKNDRLDSLVLSRVPLLHPEGLTEVSGLGPAEPLRRAVRRRVDLVDQRRACFQRIDAMLDLLGPAYNEALGSRGTKTSAVVLERYGNPKTLRRLGLSRLTDLVEKTSGGHLGAEYAASLLQAATEASTLWRGGGLDFDELAWDLAQEIRLIGQLDVEIERLDGRIAELYRSKGFSGPLLDEVVATITANRDKWVQTILEEERHLQPVANQDIMRSSVIITLATLIGHLVPLLPFVFLERSAALILAVILSGVVLFGVGAYQALTRVGSWWKQGARMVLIGLGASALGFAIGHLFHASGA